MSDLGKRYHISQLPAMLEQIRKAKRPAAGMKPGGMVTVGAAANLSAALRQETGREVPVLLLKQLAAGDLAIFDLDKPNSRAYLQSCGVDPDNLPILKIHGADQ